MTNGWEWSSNFSFQMTYWVGTANNIISGSGAAAMGNLGCDRGSWWWIAREDTFAGGPVFRSTYSFRCVH